MRQIAARGWLRRVASSAGLVLGFLFALAHPLQAQPTLVVSNYDNPGGFSFFLTTAGNTAGTIQAGSPVTGYGSGEGEACLEGGAAPEIFVSNNANNIDIFNLNSAMTGVLSATPTPFENIAAAGFTGLSLKSDGTTLYAAGQDYYVYAFNTQTKAETAVSPALPNADVHDVAYDPVTGTVYATYDGGGVVYAFTSALVPIPAKNITLPSGPSYMQEGLVVDLSGNLFVSNFGTETANNTSQPGVYEYLYSPSSPTGFQGGLQACSPPPLPAPALRHLFAAATCGRLIMAELSPAAASRSGWWSFSAPI